MASVASLTPPTLAVTPGTEAVAEIRVRNTGTVVDQFHVEVLGEASAWTTVSPPSVSLFPGAEATVRLLFLVEVTAGGPSGPVPYGVRVRSQEDPESSVVEEAILDVAPVLAIDVELVPRTSRGRRKAEHELSIDNRGTRAVQAAITAADPDQHLAFVVEPPALTAEPNTASFAKVKIRPTKPFRKGPPQTRMFQVSVAEGSHNLAVAQGMMVQEATQPPWLRRAVLASLAGLILLLALWFGLLRPTVRSAAKEAAIEAVAPPTIGPGGGGGGGGGAKEGAGGGGGGAGDGPVVAPAATGSGTTIDGRLFLNEKGSTSFEVPAGSTLQLTDIVLQNPGGEAGKLQIRREGTALLVVELSNFRDLDYHFVAPIVFTAGQKLELFADCTSPTCTPGAYFAGFLVRS